MTKAEKKAAAKLLLEFFGPNGEHWTTQRFAKDANNVEVDYDSPQAEKWCLLGATSKLKIDVKFNTVLYNSVEALGEYHGSVVRFNDADGFPPVRDFLQKIAKGEL